MPLLSTKNDLIVGLKRLVLKVAGKSSEPCNTVLYHC